MPLEIIAQMFCDVWNIMRGLSALVNPTSTPPASLGQTDTSCLLSTNERPWVARNDQSEDSIYAEVLWHQWLMSTVMANVRMTWRHNSVMTLSSSWWQHQLNISFRNTSKLSNIQRTIWLLGDCWKWKGSANKSLSFLLPWFGVQWSLEMSYSYKGWD